jgi:predicted transcriptional regulator YdeE
MTNQNKIEQAPALKIDPPRFEDGRPLLIAGLRGHFTTASFAGIAAQWERLGSYGTVPGQVGLSAGGAPDFFERYGEKFDPRTGMGDIEVWIPIQSKRSQ